ncbi:MAG: hypothetical protein HGN29_00820 [Asgard group archaeon]|nr:hypothetical protein [Asgard group archaeon]
MNKELSSLETESCLHRSEFTTHVEERMMVCILLIDLRGYKKSTHQNKEEYPHGLFSLTLRLHRFGNNSPVKVFLYDSDKRFATSFLLQILDYFTWFADFNCSDLETGTYYVRVYLSYLDQDYSSPYSRIMIFNSSGIEETTSQFLFYSSVFFMIIFFYFKKNKQKLNTHKKINT